MVGLVDDGSQFRRQALLSVTRYVGTGLAVHGIARQPYENPAHVGEASHQVDGRTQGALSAVR